MKAYIAGPLCIKEERNFLEKIDNICKEHNIKTFLPHRDCGLWKEGVNFKKIAKGDINGFNRCDLIIASLNGFNVGAGTAWEMGYAFAKGIPVIAIKTDRKISESIEEISAIVLGTTKILKSLDELDKELAELVKSSC
jgi:nucleoside 2-deoxyribosyltransferase